MKIFRTLLLCAALFVGVGATAQESAKKAKSETVIFDVNLHCGNCKAKIEKNISWEKGVKNLNVDLEKKQVTITYDPKKTDDTKLKAALEKLDFVCEKPKEEKKEEKKAD